MTQSNATSHPKGFFSSKELKGAWIKAVSVSKLQRISEYILKWGRVNSTGTEHCCLYPLRWLHGGWQENHMSHLRCSFKNGNICHVSEEPHAGFFSWETYGEVLPVITFVHDVLYLYVCCWSRNLLRGFICLTAHLSALPWFHHLLWVWGRRRRSGGQLREGGMMASVHKKSPRICQLINQGRFGGERSLPAPSWLVRAYLFRVTRGQSRLTSNYQEQPQLRPSINKKMHNEGGRTEWVAVGRQRRERRGWGWGGRDRDLSSAAELMRPDMAIKQPSVSWCLPLNWHGKGNHWPLSEQPGSIHLPDRRYFFGGCRIAAGLNCSTTKERLVWKLEEMFAVMISLFRQ